MTAFAKHWLLAAAIITLGASHALARHHHGVDGDTFSTMSPNHWKRTCIEHRAASFDTLTTDAVGLGPTSAEKQHPFLPNLSAMNATAWEQWVFDATADDGVGSIMVGLCRDPNYAFFGQGNLHVQFFAAVGDAKPIQDLVFLDHSTIFDCGDYVAGHWASAAKGYDFLFTVDRESRVAALRVMSPRFQGNLTFLATAPGHHPDGSPLGLGAGHGEEAASSAAPGLHMYNAIPGAHVAGTITVDGSPLAPPFVSSGGAGVMRYWAAAYWFDIVAGFRLIRASAGPYSFFFWDSPSRWDRSPSSGQAATHAWGALYRGAEQLVATRHHDGGGGGTSDHVRVSQTYGALGAHGKVDGGRSTGHLVEFASPATNRTWRFEVEHSRLQASMPLGAGQGVDIFSNRVWGGEVQGQAAAAVESTAPAGWTTTYLRLHRGSGYSEDALFPEELAPWRIWLVYGLSMASQGWDAVLKWAMPFLGGGGGAAGRGATQGVFSHDDL